MTKPTDPTFKDPGELVRCSRCWNVAHSMRGVANAEICPHYRVDGDIKHRWVVFVEKKEPHELEKSTNQS